ncbi:unnamed protein product [Euphydryas editha]|uniref:Glutamate receptor 1 n=1 Tax=Euphydryas editha TaxID=104508 RepID=A0AAU9UW62_EUPED|nr:unnamed protein product [Euphydryas editha]
MSKTYSWHNKNREVQVIPPSGLIDYAISLRPDYHKAVIDTVTYYGWKSIIYIYDSHDGISVRDEFPSMKHRGKTLP